MATKEQRDALMKRLTEHIEEGLSSYSMENMPAFMAGHAKGASMVALFLEAYPNVTPKEIHGLLLGGIEQAVDIAVDRKAKAKTGIRGGNLN